MTIGRHQSCAERRRKYGPLVPMDATAEQEFDIRKGTIRGLLAIFAIAAASPFLAAVMTGG